jgi:NADH-quinone oxidoreductase E subunit
MSGGSSGARKVVTNEITSDKWEKIDQIIAANKDKTGSIIPLLQKVQDVCGFLTEEVQNRIAEGLNIHPSHIYGVATFYSFFSIKTLGKNIIRVCKSTSCYIKDYVRVLEILEKELGIKAGETTPDRKFTLQVVNCIGACDMAPAMMVNYTHYGNLTSERIKEILSKFK